MLPPQWQSLTYPSRFHSENGCCRVVSVDSPTIWMASYWIPANDFLQKLFGGNHLKQETESPTILLEHKERRMLWHRNSNEISALQSCTPMHDDRVVASLTSQIPTKEQWRAEAVRHLLTTDWAISFYPQTPFEVQMLPPSLMCQRRRNRFAIEHSSRIATKLLDAHLWRTSLVTSAFV